jgi:hypothetical protein
MMKGDDGPKLAKTAEYYTLPELKQNIEALANLSFSRGLPSIQDVSTRLDSFEVVTSMDGVSRDDARAAYMATYQSLLEHYRAVKQADKQVLLIQLRLSEAAAASQKVYVTTQIGQTTRAKSMIACSNYFENGYMVGWPVSGEYGTCDGTGYANGDIFGVVDADTKLNNALATIVSSEIDPSITSSSNCFAGWLEVSGGQNPEWYMPNSWDPFYVSYPNPNDAIPNDGHRDYLVYTSLPHQEDIWDSCIEEEDMNWYLCNYVDIVHSVPPPTDMVLVWGGVYYDEVNDEEGCLCYPEQHFVAPLFGTPLYASDCSYTPPGDQPAAEDEASAEFDPEDGAYAPSLPDYGEGPL